MGCPSCLDQYLEDITVVRCNFKNDGFNEAQSHTLKELVQSCQFLLIYILSSSTQPNPTFLQALHRLIKNKNCIQSSNSPGKLKRIFGIGKKSTENIGDEVLTYKFINILVIDLEFLPNEQNLIFTNEFDCYFLPSKFYLAKSQLLSTLDFAHAPALFVVDCADTKQITQVYRDVLEDPDGKQFPWQNLSRKNQFFGKNILQNSLNGSLLKVDFGTLQRGVKGLFFGAKWCPPSRHMTKQLCEIYAKLKAQNDSFEIIFCSSDRSEESFLEYFSNMPWLAFPYGSEKQLSKAYDVRGIPAFLLLDEDFNVITRNGCSLIISNPQGYPWKQKMLYELTEHTAYRLSEMPSLILFTEGLPEDTEFSIQFLNSCSQFINSSSEKHDALSECRRIGTNPILQIFYTGEDPICDYILESLGQKEAELPLLLICDITAGYLTICEEPNVDECVLREFVADYRAVRAKVSPLPTPPRQKQNTILLFNHPTDMVEQLILQKQSGTT